VRLAACADDKFVDGIDGAAVRFEDLFDLTEIQKLQDAFANATGVASIITDPDGRPITAPSNYCRLCRDIIHKTPMGCENCQASDAVLGSMHPDGPVMQPCLSVGLWDGGTSITVGGRHIANWIAGQVLVGPLDLSQMRLYAREIGADETEFMGAIAEVKRMTREQFADVCQFLHLLANQLSHLAVRNAQQARYITERQNVEDVLRSAKLVAEGANAAKDRFLAMVSHELRTPLTPALLSISQLASSSGLAPELREELSTVQRHIEMEARIIDDLLDLSRIIAGKLSLETAPCDLHAAIDATIRVCREDLDRKQIHLQTNLQARRHFVEGDHGRLEQVFWNLLKNAIKFTPRNGSITIRTRTEGTDGAQAIITEVADTGVGMEATATERIFGIFEQAGADSRKLGGLGIGLAICRGIVEAHHGTVTASSFGLGHGSTFTVTLPVTLSRPAVTAPTLSDPSATPAALQILLVEDHEATATILGKLLQRLGHRVAIAHSLAGAVKLFSLQPFDLLISDIGLPDGTGVDLINHMRKSSDMPAIALSGFGMDNDIQRSISAGFAEHIIKPVDFTRLRDAVARVSRKRAPQPAEGAFP